jgi:hypothetical protein
MHFVLLSLALIVGASSARAAIHREALWVVLQSCLVAHKTAGIPFPCLAVNLASNTDPGYAVLRAPFSPAANGRHRLLAGGTRGSSLRHRRARGPDPAERGRPGRKLERGPQPGPVAHPPRLLETVGAFDPPAARRRVHRPLETPEGPVGGGALLRPEGGGFAGGGVQPVFKSGQFAGSAKSARDKFGGGQRACERSARGFYILAYPGPPQPSRKAPRSDVLGGVPICRALTKRRST